MTEVTTGSQSKRRTAAARLAAGTPAARASSAEGGAHVSFTDVTRSFGPTKALDGLTVDIAPGELLALLGPSGCGKTTALRVLAGFERNDSGQVLIDGHDITSVPARKRDMGMVFQSYSLFPTMTALDNVAYGLRLRRQSGAVRRHAAQDLLDMVGLAPQAKRYPHQMSGGQQQRVALARALAIEPRVLLLDEPLSALDAKVRVGLREQIRSLQQRLGTTTLFVTHDQEEALSMADRVGVMLDGRLEQVATPTELYTQPATPFVAEFVGTMNRIPGQTVDQQVTLLGSTVAFTGPTAARGVVDVLVRPENLDVTPDRSGDAIVTSRSFRGAVTRLGVQLSGDCAVWVDVSSDAGAAIAPGDPVKVTLTATRVLVDVPR
jgi:putative spermidine/putrescine transport system ATP-binding protein